RSPVDGDEPGGLVGPARRDQYVVGPKHELVVTGPPGEADALLDEAGPDPVAASLRLDEQEPELTRVLVAADAEHASHRLAVKLGDPRVLAPRVVVVDVVGDDAGYEGLEGGVPAVPVGGHHAVAVHRPTQGPRP